MTLLETLRAHKGGLLHLKTELYWYDGRGWDGIPDRICLVLDAAASAAVAASAAFAGAAAPAALLLIDGAPQWVWVAQEDVELIT